MVEEFNTLVNELKTDKKILNKENYQWLEDSDEKKYMTDKEILDKYRPRQFMFDRIRKERSEGYSL